MQVYETFSVGADKVYRYRKCVSCKTTFTTLETMVDIYDLDEETKKEIREGRLLRYKKRSRRKKEEV